MEPLRCEPLIRELSGLDLGELDARLMQQIEQHMDSYDFDAIRELLNGRVDHG